MKKQIAVMLLAIAGAGLSGCSTTIKDLGAYRSAPMMEADVMPNKDQLEARRIKVVVFEAEDSSGRRIAQAGSVMTQSLASKVSDGGSEIIDRNLANKLQEEVSLAEAKGVGSYSGPAVADFAIKAVLGSINYGNKFVQASTICDKKGRCNTYPAHCEHSAGMAGTVRVYEIPSLRLVTSINVNGSAYVSTETYCNSSPAEGLMLKSIENGIHSARTEVQNLFAPKGYVVEKRVNGDKSIFKVMFGTSQGAKSQNSVKIFSLRKNENQLTGKTTVEEIPIATGTISDQVTSEHSWVVVDSADVAKQIRLGDFVKVVYKKGMLEF